MRGPPRSRTDRQPVSFELVARPASGTCRHSCPCLWPHLWLRTPRPRRSARRGRNARLQGCPGVRDGREAEGPCGFTNKGQWFLCQPGHRRRCVPTAPASRLRWNSPVGASTGIAVRTATAGRMRQEACACPVVAAKMVLPVAWPAGCPRVRDRRLQTSPARPGNRSRHPRHRSLPRSPVHPAEVAALRRRNAPR